MQDQGMAEVPTSFHFEPVAAEDFEAMVALRIEAMRPSLEALGRFDPERARERLRSSFAPSCMRHIVSRGQRVGFVTVREEPDAGPRVRRLEHLYLLPDRQGGGLGARVLRQVLAEAQAEGCAVRVDALRGSAANRFYERHGFMRIAEAEWDIAYRWQPGGAA